MLVYLICVDYTMDEYLHPKFYMGTIIFSYPQLYVSVIICVCYIMDK